MNNRTVPSILVMTKRQYMGKDLIDDAYGRFRELPLELAALGHATSGVTLAYQRKGRSLWVDGADETVRWLSVDLRRPRLVGAFGHVVRLLRIVRDERPEILLAGSDAFHVIAATLVGRVLGIPVAVDLYDNFESYEGMSFPGVKRGFRAAVRAAAVVTCVSEELAHLVRSKYRREGPVAVVQNGYRSDLFVPSDRQQARRALGLDPAASIVGLIGAIDESRGLHVALAGVESFAQAQRNVRLLLAGPRFDGFAAPRGIGVSDFDVVSHHNVPRLMAACDIVLVPNRISAFGRYCHPQKAVEAAACGVTIVAADTPVMRLMLNGSDSQLYDPTSPADLHAKLDAVMRGDPVHHPAVQNWASIASELSELLRTPTRRR